VTATLVAAPGHPDDRSTVIDWTPCACGALAVVVLAERDEGALWAEVRCLCGAFSPVAAEGSRR
jgi:hypothetical protein